MGRSIGWALVVDDDPHWLRLIGARFRELLPTVVAHDVPSALAAVERPGLVGAIIDGVLDPRSDALDGIDLLALPLRARFPDAAICVFSGTADLVALKRAQRAGCPIGTKDLPLPVIVQLAREWRRVARVTDAATAQIENELDRLLLAGTLTLPQVEQVRLAAQGMSYAQIAKELDCSRQAVEMASKKLEALTGRTTAAWAHEVCVGTVRLPHTMSPEGPATGTRPALATGAHARRRRAR